MTLQGADSHCHLLIWLAAANSFAMDFLVRMKVTLSMALTILDSLPFPRLAVDDVVGTRLAERALRLTCTGLRWGLWDEFSQNGLVPRRHADEILGANDREQRLRLRADIEVELAVLYGLTRDELGHVLDTFPIVQKDDTKTYGDFRTKVLVLERYDALARPRGARVIPLPVEPASRRTPPSLRQPPQFGRCC